MDWCKNMFTIKNQLWFLKDLLADFNFINSAIIQYKVTNFWSKEHERTLIWNDKDIKIVWPSNFFGNKEFLISKKDTNGETYKSLLKSCSLF